MTEPFRKEFAWSSRYRFADWPNASVPNVAAGVYLIWEEARLIYVGMSGRKIEAGREQHRSRAGLVTRLASHASGRLSGDQFCVYVANRIVIPRLNPDQLPRFEAGDLRLDHLTKAYIHERLTYQFTIVASGAEAFQVEDACRRGELFGEKPWLNPG